MTDTPAPFNVILWMCFSTYRTPIELHATDLVNCIIGYSWFDAMMQVVWATPIPCMGVSWTSWSLKRKEGEGGGGDQVILFQVHDSIDCVHRRV